MGAIGLSMYHWRIAFQMENNMISSFHRYIYHAFSSLVFVAAGMLFQRHHSRQIPLR